MTGLFRTVAGRLALLLVPGAALVGVGILAWQADIARTQRGLAERAASVHAAALAEAEREAAALAEAAQASAAQADAVRLLQIGFRMQVLAFKSLLLRGERPDQAEIFLAEFDRRHAEVGAQGEALRRSLGDDAAARDRLDRFLGAHRQLTASYRNAWNMLSLAESYYEGQRRADDYMVGRDAEPDKLLAELVAAILDGAAARTAAGIAANRSANAEALAAGRAELDVAVAGASRRVERVGMIAIAAFAVAVLALLAVIAVRLRPLRATAGAIDRLAAGDLSVRLPVRGRDEIARMADALNRALGAIAGTLGSERVDWAALAAARGEGAVRLNSDLQATAEGLAAASIASADAGAASEAQAQAVTAKAAAISASIETLAAAVEELGSSLATVAAAGQRSAASVEEAASHARAARTAVEELSAASREVAAVVGGITRISQQVNLLALNATIEAARAGEAGRGFTVVAHEVKILAGTTGEAAADIGRKAEAMQAVSRSTAEAIGAITALMEHVAPLAREVGGQVEQQTATVREVTSAVSAIAGEARGIAADAERLAGVTATVARGASTTRQAAATLRSLAADLRRVLGG